VPSRLSSAIEEVFVYDLLLRGGTLVDALHGVEGLHDLAVEDGRVAEVAPAIEPSAARETVDLSGLTVMPGIIDSHCHVGGAGMRGDRSFGYRMAAETGVTTLLDMGGTTDVLIAGMQARGAGLNVAGLFLHSAAFGPDHNDPSTAEIEVALAEAVEAGAFGLKVSGGHVPMTLDATARAVEVANRMGVYAAYHVGTTTAGSRITGLRELPDILGNEGCLHVAHVNSYCRGLDAPALDESAEALAILRGLRGRVVSESYLSLFNGTGGHCSGDEVVDHVTQNCLAMRGYLPTRTDLGQAILDGFCFVNAERGERVVLLTGAEGLAAWEAAGTHATVSFPVCPPETTFHLAVAREADGSFAVDAISTDGGGIPRNFLVEKGLALVRLGALSLPDYVRKVSLNPSRMLGLPRKGHLGVGADADITVLDLRTDRPVRSFVGGRPVLVDGRVVGAGGTVLTTEAGRAQVEGSGLPVEVVDVRQAALYRGGVAAVLAGG